MMARSRSPGGAGAWRLLSIALAVRLAYIAIILAVSGADGLLTADSARFLSEARSFANGLLAGEISGWKWLGESPGVLPLVPLALGLITAATGSDAAIVFVVVQATLDAITVVLIARTAALIRKDWFWPTGVLAAVNPTMVVLSGIVLTDTVFVLWVTLAIYGVIGWLKAPAWRPAIVAGVGFALALLTRSLIYPFVPVTILFLLATALWQRQGFGRAFAQVTALAAIFALALGLILARNVDRYDAAAVTSQTGAHVLLWLVPLTMEAKTGIPWQEAANKMNRRFDARAGAADQQSNFARSAAMTAMGLEELWRLGPSAVAKAWIYGAAINLGAPAVTMIPPVQALPRTGFYATPGATKLEKVVNFFFRNENALYAWLLAVGALGVIAFRLVQLYGIWWLIARGGRLARVALLYLILWCGFVLAVNGPIASPKYRLPIEPALMIFAGAGYWALRNRVRRAKA